MVGHIARSMTDEFIVKDDGFRGWIFRQDETTRLVAEFHGAPPGQRVRNGVTLWLFGRELMSGRFFLPMNHRVRPGTGTI
jgi:hypothetical protein